MWFVDIILDLTWFSERKGNLGKPRARSTQSIPGHDLDNTFLLYGDDQNIRHLRVMLHTNRKDPPNDIVDSNIHRWVNLIEVSSGLVAARTSTTASLGPNSSGMMVIIGEGDEDSDCLQLDPQYAPPTDLNYDAAAMMMAAWEPDYHIHLFYLGRFLNHDLPPEVRWLNGYRVIEWHFRRGEVGRAKDQRYRDFLEKHGDKLDPLLGSKQDRKGLMEEVRALAAHALQSRAADPRLDGASTNLIIKTFHALEILVMALMNEGTGGKVSFLPKSPH